MVKVKINSPARLENWAVVDGRTPYDAPETQRLKLTGNVYGHPFFKDGEEVTTSTVQQVDKERELVLTRNTIYTLGKPHPNYEKQFPNAFERIFK